MFSCDSDDEDKIISCVFDDIDLNKISADDIFSTGSKWKDQSLLFSTVQAYDSVTGREKNRKFTSGSLCKDCEWEITIRSTKNNTR